MRDQKSCIFRSLEADRFTFIMIPHWEKRRRVSAALTLAEHLLFFRIRPRPASAAFSVFPSPAAVRWSLSMTAPSGRTFPASKVVAPKTPSKLSFASSRPSQA